MEPVTAHPNPDHDDDPSPDQVTVEAVTAQLGAMFGGEVQRLTLTLTLALTLALTRTLTRPLTRPLPLPLTLTRCRGRRATSKRAAG